MFLLVKMSVILTVALVAVFVIFGLLLGIIERATLRTLLRSYGEKSIIITGMIGTTIHELSHFLMCKIFFHKVNNVKLFSFKIKDNTLGYVNHSYNRKNPYARLGNFFIGIAPILFGTAIIILLFRLLLPQSWDIIISKFSFSSYINLSNHFNLVYFLEILLKDSWLIIKTLFAWDNIISIRFWIFLFIVFSISNHMSLSRADINNLLDGLIFIFLLNFLICGVFLLLGISFNKLIHLVLSYNILLITFLFVALIFSLISYILVNLISIVK